MVQVLVQVLVRGLSSSDFGSGFGSGNLFRCWTIGQAVWAWHAERAGRASMACMAEWAGSGVCMHVLIVNAMADNIYTYIHSVLRFLNIRCHLPLSPACIAMAWACHNSRRQSCLSYAAASIPRRIIDRLLEEGVDFLGTSRGALEYSDDGICICLVACVDIARAVDLSQGMLYISRWSSRGDGAYTRAAKTLSLAILADRRYATQICLAETWEDVEIRVRGPSVGVLVSSF